MIKKTNCKVRQHCPYPTLLVLFIISLLISGSVQSQTIFSGYETLYTPPKSYTLYHAEQPLKMDGILDEQAWAEAPWTDDFIDIEGLQMPKPVYRTRVKMLWDDKYLYIAASMEEPHLWANPQAPGDIIFKDNVFKIFIDPDNNMNDDFEIQINPNNLMLFLIMNKPYRDGGVPVSGWVPIGLQSAVKLNGTLSNSSDKDSGWLTEIAIPLASLNFHPRDSRKNTSLRINFMRTGWDFTVQNGVYSKKMDAAGKALPPHYAVWSSQGLINMHLPERWGYTIFSPSPPAGQNVHEFVLPYSEKQRDYLWLVYYKQKDWLKKAGQYAGSLKDLAIPKDEIKIDGKMNKLSLEASSKQFLASISDGSGKIITINQDGYVQ